MSHRADQLAVLNDGRAGHALNDAAGILQQIRVGDLDGKAFGAGRGAIDGRDGDAIAAPFARGQRAKDLRLAGMHRIARSQGDFAVFQALRQSAKRADQVSRSIAVKILHVLQQANAA